MKTSGKLDRNALAVRLLAGESVSFEQTGGGMAPRILAGQCVRLVPVLGRPPRSALVDSGDVVFCKQGDRWCLRVVVRVEQWIYHLCDGRGAPCGLTTDISGKVEGIVAGSTKNQ